MQTFFAPAKLNLFLHVVGRRADGYHLLESAFQLIDLGDDIGIAVRQDGAIVRTTDVPGVPEADDLVVRAARLLQRASGCALGADIAVSKRIPMGGGLGGGSSDAATVLLALNRLWGLDMDRSRLAALGLSLGADVPFFIFGQNAFARGVGEDLAALELPSRWFVVLAPQCSVPTADIFRAPELTRNTASVKMVDFSTGAWAFPRETFRNDLEPVACAKFPAVARALEWLRGHDGAASVSARMTGSGACVFAAFDSREAALAVCAARPAECGGFVASGLESHPMAGFARAA
jgi:4-diphosphocytidyl-2-C-methyl-D-erythritol kinase